MTMQSSGNGHEQQELLRRAAREFVEQTCTLARRLEIEREGGFSPDIWRSLAEMQWTGILIPEEYGGVGGALGDAAVIYEEMGRELVPSPHHSSSVLAALILSGAASEEQKQRYLPLIASGQQVFVPAITEDDQWGAEISQLRAVRRGDSYVLDGVKQYVPDAGQADQLICAARTDIPASLNDGEWTASVDTEDDAGSAVTLFLVSANDRGVTMRRMAGWTGQPLYEVEFDGVTVPASDVIGPVGGGWEAIQPALRTGTVLLCAYMAGAAERVYELTIDYSHHRVQFGQSISRFQRVQDHCISQRNHVDAARLTTQEALERLEQNDPQAEKYISLAKALASEGFYQTCEAAHHVHAGVGSVKDYGLYLYTKASHSLYHYLGSPDFHEERVGELLAAEPG